jgi:hypothetical protein
VVDPGATVVAPGARVVSALTGNPPGVIGVHVQHLVESSLKYFSISPCSQVFLVQILPHVVTPASHLQCMHSP